MSAHVAPAAVCLQTAMTGSPSAPSSEQKKLHSDNALFSRRTADITAFGSGRIDASR